MKHTVISLTQTALPTYVRTYVYVCMYMASTPRHLRMYVLEVPIDLLQEGKCNEREN